MRPVLPQRLDWSSVIGLFILNFGSLELALLECLKWRLPEKRWNAQARKSFHERVQCLRELVSQPAETVTASAEWEALIVRLGAVRDLRNHLAHSTLVNTLADDLKTWTQRLVLTKEFACAQAETRQVSFDELHLETTKLADLIGELVKLVPGE